MTSLVRRLVAGLFFGLILVTGAVWLACGQLIAPVPHASGQPPADLDAQSVVFASESGSTIHGWFCRGAPGHGVILLLHGVRGSRLDMVSRAEFLHRLGYSVLLIDFQAHGESPGSEITFGYLESRDVVAALRFLRRELPEENIGVIGVSLGAAAVVLADERPHVDAVVLESMYPTIEQATKDRLRLHLGWFGPALAPLLMVQLQPRLGVGPSALRPADRIKALDTPVFIMSGTLDRHTSIVEARELYLAAGEPKRFWAVEGAAHVDLHQFAGVVYERNVADFLDRYLRAQAP